MAGRRHEDHAAGLLTRPPGPPPRPQALRRCRLTWVAPPSMIMGRRAGESASAVLKRAPCCAIVGPCACPQMLFDLPGWTTRWSVGATHQRVPNKDTSWPRATPPVAPARLLPGNAPHLVREDPRASRGPAAPLPPDRQLRLADRQRGVGRCGRAPSRRGRGRLEQVRSAGDLRGDLPDRGLQRDHVALLRGPGLLRPQVHRRRVQGEGLHLLRSALRLGGVHQQRHR